MHVNDKTQRAWLAFGLGTNWADSSGKARRASWFSRQPRDGGPKKSEELEACEAPRPTGFRPVYVFDIRQTDGKDLPVICSVSGDPRGYLRRLALFAARQGIVIEYSEDIAPAIGLSSGGKITLLPGQPPADEFVTLSHELAHELLHRNHRRCELPIRVRETEAEAVAFVVSQAIGLETLSAAKDYIQLYDGDAELLAERLENIQWVANEILQGICV